MGSAPLRPHEVEGDEDNGTNEQANSTKHQEVLDGVGIVVGEDNIASRSVGGRGSVVGRRGCLSLGLLVLQHLKPRMRHLLTYPHTCKQQNEHEACGNDWRSSRLTLADHLSATFYFGCPVRGDLFVSFPRTETGQSSRMTGRSRMKLAWLVAAAAVSIGDGFLVPSAAMLARAPTSRSLPLCKTVRSAARAPSHRLMACNPGDNAEKKPSRWQRFVAGVAEKGPKFVMGDVSREKLQEMGLSVLLSYGWVSNVNMACVLILSWVTFGKTSGLSPLAAGQWPGFLAVYMGFWLACNFLRPFRLAAAAAISPLFDRVLNFFQDKLSIAKPSAVLMTLFLVNIVGTLTLVCGGLTIATSLTGTPLLPAGMGLRQYLLKA